MTSLHLRLRRSCSAATVGRMSGSEIFLQQLIIGLSNGMIIALIALGYTMVYGIIELINFAHGDLFMLGCFCALTLVGLLGLDQLAAGSRGACVGLLLMLLVVPVVLRRIELARRSPRVSPSARIHQAGAAGLGHRRFVRVHEHRPALGRRADESLRPGSGRRRAESFSRAGLQRQPARPKRRASSRRKDVMVVRRDAAR